MALKLGQTVETSTQQQGLVRYIGAINVAEGIWLGIELPSPEGKNDGSIRGERYFTCPPMHGLFIREGNVSRVIAQPPQKASATKAPATAASAPAKPKAPTPALKPRPSSVAAAKPAPRPSSIVSKRQSIAPVTSRVAPARTPVRKASIASSSITSASETTARSAPRPSIAPSTASSSTLRSSRDTSSIETLQTKIRHLEKQLADEQERNRELSQARDERDRFHNIINKLQLKCQTLHSENNELKAHGQGLQTENDALKKAEEDHESKVELATIDKLVAEEEKDRIESELGDLRMKIQEQELDLDLAREEIKGYTEDLTPEQRENAGFKQLQYENGRLREAIHMLKDQTMDQERELRSIIQELEAEASQVEPLNTEVNTLKQELVKTTEINEHLRGQLDANVELEEQFEELTARNQELEDRIVQLDTQNRELEALRELNDDIDAQREGQVEDLQTELDARDAELSQQNQLINQQNATIIDQADLITKLRELAFEFQGKAENAESSRTMTETQAKDTTSRFNEVMDLNRRLRASNVQATNKEITSELRKLAAEEANEKLAIYQQTESKDFENSESLRSYFTAKSIAAKADLVSTLLSTTDRQLSYNGGLEEASARVHCNQAVYHLELLKVGSDRLWSAMSVSSLEEFGSFGPMYQELLIVEKALDQGLDVLKADEVRFDELSASFGRSVKIQEELVSRQTEALLNCKENETLSRVQNFYASLRCLDTNYAIVITMLKFMVVNSETLSEEAEQALERVESSAAPCSRAMLQCQKLVKVLENLKADSLRPVFQEDERSVFVDYRQKFSKAALAAPEWSQKALKAIKAVLDSSDSEARASIDINVVAGFTDKHELEKMEKATDQIELWIEFCSVLMNNVEFEHGPSPWTQKALETADARKKHEEVLAQLEQLKAERKATQTSLIESSQLIETKQLAIDHLEAKYREASKKISEQKQLDDKLEQAMQNAKQATEQLLAQQKETTRLREFAAQSARSDAMSPIPDSSNTPARQAAEDITQTQRTTPAGTMIFIEALQNENHWLRQRENSDIFGRSMRHMATTFKNERRMDQRMYEEYDEESCFNLIGEDENALYQPRRRLLEKRAENRQLQEEDAQSSPLTLDNVKFGSVWGSPSPGEQVHRMHLHVQHDEEDMRWLDFGADISEFEGSEIFW